MAEVHLIIVWSKGLHQKKEIISDVKTKFQILEEYSIKWSKEKFPENLSRFYGENLPKNSRKEKHCGTDTFICLVVLDLKPRYSLRATSKGDKVVNVNLFDAKQLYRTWTGGGHKIHATDNINETKYQLALLINKTYSYYLNRENFSHEIIVLESNLIGADGWKSITDIFSVLQEASNYLVLRNYDNLEEELNALHPDIDVLCDDKDLFVRLINGTPSTTKKYRVQYSVEVDNKVVFFDVRHVGDDYYCSKWERNLLTRKIRFGELYIPDLESYYYTLIYHALLHKPNLTNDYYTKLIRLGSEVEGKLNEAEFLERNLINRLTNFMDRHDYHYTVPIDRTVFWNYKLLSNVGMPCLALNRKFLYEKYRVKLLLKKVLKKVGLYATTH